MAPRKDFSPLMREMELRSRRVATISSRLLASATVQVTIEAINSPTMTLCTTISAEANIPQGERSCGSNVDFCGAAGWPTVSEAGLEAPSPACVRCPADGSVVAREGVSPLTAPSWACGEATMTVHKSRPAAQHASQLPADPNRYLRNPQS